MSARCFVLGANGDALDSGAAAVYGEYMLMRTKALLPERITIPDDVCPLVQAAYDSALEPSCKMPDGYGAAKEKCKKNLSDKENHAKTYRIDTPWKGTDSTLEGWLNVCLTDAAGEAAVRDTGDSLEVVAIKRTGDGGLALISTGQALPPGAIDDANARRVARESLRLPPALCKQYMIERTITELERRTKADVPLWRQSPWLKDALVLVFDKNNETRLLGYRLKYDEFYGLEYEKEDVVDGQKGV